MTLTFDVFQTTNYCVFTLLVPLWNFPEKGSG